MVFLVGLMEASEEGGNFECIKSDNEVHGKEQNAERPKKRPRKAKGDKSVGME